MAPAPRGTDLLPVEFVATLSVNLEGLGYALSQPLFEACRRLSREELGRFYRQLSGHLAQEVGAHREFSPMYPNFPQQVMEMSRAELYFNAVIHYWTAGQLMPATRKKFRLRLQEPPKVKFIDLGTTEEFEGLFTQIAGANVAFSEQDREDLAWFVQAYGADIARLLPESVPQRENVAHLAALLRPVREVAEGFVRTHVKTATDVLRLACALSEGDVSLAEATKFKAISRPWRRTMLEILEAHPNARDDMFRRPERWKRLGERLHPGEFADRFPKTAWSFELVREDIAGETFRGEVEEAVREGNVPKATWILATRPGEFVRRLDHLLRLDPDESGNVLSRLKELAGEVSTPVLLQARHHFATRGAPRELRVFMPKGDVAKSHAEPNRLASLPDAVVREVVGHLEAALVERFSGLAPLGRVYVDERLCDYPTPFAMRSASRALRTLPRGSRMPLPDAETLRMFLWWTNGVERTDIDLSAVLFGDEFVYLDTISYYNLRAYGGAHSGDIVDAPKGASEFIDLNVGRLRKLSVRYVGMVVTSYSRQPFVELPECFAGWMARNKPQSGEIYEPRTVQDRLDLTADTQVSIPILFDLADRRAIWCDMALRRRPSFGVDVRGNQGGIVLTMRSMANLSKPNLYDLARMHAKARGTLVNSPEEADTVFSVEGGFPFELERIASEFMA